MSQFDEHNSYLETNMNTLLLELQEWGIWEDDYNAFLTKRCEKLSEEIRKRLVLREQDKNAQQSVNIEDLDELVLEADL